VFPDLARVSAYATPINLLRKSEAELRELRERKLSLIYVGVESGSADILRRIRKGATPKTMAKALDKARAAGIKISATVILGLGGRNRWEEHIAGTADLINTAPPSFLSTLQLEFRMPGVEKRFRDAFKEPFAPQDEDGLLVELERLVSLLDPPHPVVFRSNHASNMLPLKGNLPTDRDRLMAQVAGARVGAVPLRHINIDYEQKYP